MFERKIEETIAFLTNATIGDQDRFTSRQIIASMMPAGLRVFFERDIQTWVDEEKRRLLESSHFVFSDEQILARFDGIVEVLPEYAQFSAAEYKQALERNVKLLFNFICRPQWSLVRYFFTDREYVAADEIVLGMRHFWHYEYYRLILTEYFSKKGIDVINARKFQDLVANIDHEVIRGFDSKKLASLTEPLFDLFNLGSESEPRIVPLEALSIFFDDKDLTVIVERLDNEKNSREYITMHDLVLLIGDVDYTMSLDISSIVSKHAQALGVMQPERFDNAGKDFEIPAIGHSELDPVDVGDEERQLDFVITDEEMGVVERDFDHIAIMNTVLDDDEEQLELESVDAAPDPVLPASEEEAGPGENGSVLGENGDDEFLRLEEVDEEDVPHLGFGEEMILEIEDELEVEHDADTESDPDAVQTLFGADENEDHDTEQTRADADEIAEIGLIDEAIITPSTQMLLNDEIEMDVFLDDEDTLEPGNSAERSTELSIDWEKEAANIPDISIESETEPHAMENTQSSIHLKEGTDLKPAEELLSQLNLEDLDEDSSPSASESSNPFDIPLIDEEVVSPREIRREDKDEIEELPVPAEDVIRQYGDLSTLINPSDQKKYARRLFGRNDEAVKRALAVLNGKPTWREASEYIDELFIKHDVDMYSKMAVQFTDDIYKRYLARK